MHGLGHHIGVQIGLADLPGHQVLGDHAKGCAACRLHTACHRAHQSDITRTIDQPHPGLRDTAAKRFGVMGKSGIFAGA